MMEAKWSGITASRGIIAALQGSMNKRQILASSVLPLTGEKTLTERAIDTELGDFLLLSADPIKSAPKTAESSAVIH